MEAIVSVITKDEHKAEAYSQISSASTHLLRNEYVPAFEQVKSHVETLDNYSKEKFYKDLDKDWPLRVINTVSNGRCRCETYVSRNMNTRLPKYEVDRGLFVIKSKKEIPWQDEYTCECTDCGQILHAKEEHGYHYPQALWTKIT